MSQGPLFYAARTDDLSSVFQETKGWNAPDVTQDGRTPVMVAAMYGSLCVLRHVHACGLDIGGFDMRGQCALSYAVPHHCVFAYMCVHWSFSSEEKEAALRVARAVKDPVAVEMIEHFQPYVTDTTIPRLLEETTLIETSICVSRRSKRL
jgi:hypothetical protein